MNENNKKEEGITPLFYMIRILKLFYCWLKTTVNPFEGYF